VRRGVVHVPEAAASSPDSRFSRISAWAPTAAARHRATSSACTSIFRFWVSAAPGDGSLSQTADAGTGHAAPTARSVLGTEPCWLALTQNRKILVHRAGGRRRCPAAAVGAHAEILENRETAKTRRPSVVHDPRRTMSSGDRRSRRVPSTAIRPAGCAQAVRR